MQSKPAPVKKDIEEFVTTKIQEIQGVLVEEERGRKQVEKEVQELKSIILTMREDAEKKEKEIVELKTTILRH